MTNREYCMELAAEMLERHGMETVTHYMDDAICGELHEELAPCTDMEFVAAYIEAHKERFGEEFTIN